MPETLTEILITFGLPVAGMLIIVIGLLISIRRDEHEAKKIEEENSCWYDIFREE